MESCYVCTIKLGTHMGAPHIDMDPLELQVKNGSAEPTHVVIVNVTDDTIPVELLPQGRAIEDVFQDPQPTTPFDIAGHSAAVFRLKRPLGLQARPPGVPSFSDDKSEYALLMTLKHPNEAHIGIQSHADLHIEC